MKIGVTTVLTFAILSHLPAHAGNVSELVGGMSAADKQSNYEGIFVLRKSDKMVSMHVVHGVDARGVWESMEALNGEARKIVRHNNEVISIYPDRKLVTVSKMGNKPGLHPILPENLDKLGNYYTINQMGEDRIAGRQTSVLNVLPKDAFRYGYRYWLDNETRVLLKCDLLDENGEIVEQMMYTAFHDHSAVPPTAFTVPELKGYTHQTLPKTGNEKADTGWRATSIPQGFMLTKSTLRKGEGSNSAHLMYTDGLASVSVFIESDANSPQRLAGASNMGALNVYGRQVNGVQITVMGEVPEATLVAIAESMERTQ
ncbi:MAG: MucB/RseB C-terminal domain-containing protein [Thiotrichales bacterium]|nr:MAG: MucB/RseB C-terminal domain-containing protein [Thiotrichales bacterium]